MDNHYKKYLKYKRKYLNQRYLQIGGGICTKDLYNKDDESCVDKFQRLKFFFKTYIIGTGDIGYKEFGTLYRPKEHCDCKTFLEEKLLLLIKKKEYLISDKDMINYVYKLTLYPKNMPGHIISDDTDINKSIYIYQLIEIK